MEGTEKVLLQIGMAKDYLAISVTDQFGSLDKDAVLAFIRKDYVKQEYVVKENDPSAGLGIYGLIGSGLSLLFVSQYQKRTQVILFVPLTESFKAFRESFRFFSFLLK